MTSIPVAGGLLTPNIDVQSSIGVIEDRKKGELTDVITLSGYRLPATEASIADSKGNKVFLVGGAAYGSPLKDLAGTNSYSVASATVTVNKRERMVLA